MSHFYIGISGWRYAPWRKNFYPKGLVQKRNCFSLHVRFVALRSMDLFTHYKLQRAMQAGMRTLPIILYSALKHHAISLISVG